MIHPLVVDAQVALQFAQVGDGIFRKHSKAEAGDQLWDGMVDLPVIVVRTARKDNAVTSGLLKPSEGFLALSPHGRLEGLVFLPGGVYRSRNLLLGGEIRKIGRVCTLRQQILLALLDQVFEEAKLQGLFVVIGNEGVEELDGAVNEGIDVELEGLGVAHDNRAVVVIVGLGVLLALPADAGHPDEVNVAGKQVHDVAVGEFGRIAHALGGHGLDARLVGLLGGGVGQFHPIPEVSEESVPEGVVLIHVQGSGDSHGAPGGLVFV